MEAIYYLEAMEAIRSDECTLNYCGFGCCTLYRGK